MNWRVGVAGFPIEHSRSPQLHEFGLRYAGLRGTSERVSIDLEHADDIPGLMGSRFDALSITMPLKKVVAKQCAWLDPTAQRLGVVNTVRWRDGILEGSSFDGPGFVDALLGEWRLPAEGLRVVVEGSGGSALAIVDTLVERGASDVGVRARNPVTVQQLLDLSPVVHVAGDDDVAVHLVVNTTPVHSRSEPPVMSNVTSETVAIDVTYDPLVSPWCRAYDDRGVRTGNGLAMLAYQAALAMQWWWGVEQNGHALLEAIS